MRTPLLPVAVAFATGIVAGHFLHGPAVWVIGTLLVLLALLPASMVWRSRGARLARAGQVGLLTLMMCVGFWCITLQEHLVRADDMSHIVHDEAFLTLRGTVVSRPEQRSYSTTIAGQRNRKYTRFDLDVSDHRTSGEWHTATGRVRVSVRAWTSKIAPGDRVELFGKVYRPRDARNPADFDYAHYLNDLGIRRCMSVVTDEAVTILQHPGMNLYALGILGKSARNSPVFENQDHPEHAGMLRCLILGERHAIDPEIEKHFRESGTMHLLAVSGLHVAVLLGTLWYSLRLASVPERGIALVVMVVAVVYAVIAGLRPSVVRAALVAVIFCGGVLLRRRPSFLNSLSLAAIIILLLEPGLLFTSGFQLSFLAVLGISVFTGPLTRWLSGFAGEELFRLGAWDSLGLRRAFNMAVVKALAVSIAALVLIMPLSAYYFRNVNFLTPLFNIVLFPVLWLVLVTGFAAAALPIAPMVWASQASVSMLLGLAEVFSRTPGSILYVPRPPWWWVVLYFAGLTALLFHRRLRLRPAVPLSTVGLLVAGAFLWMGLRGPAHDQLTVFDVGQGSATAVLTREGRVLVYDVGSSDEGGVGERTMTPFLLDAGVHAVDVLVLSHSDADHVNGLKSLLERIRVRRALLSPSFAWTDSGRGVLRMLDDKGVRIDFARRGTHIRLSESVRAEVLHPSTNDAQTRRLSVNDTSVVLRVHAPAGIAQLWGDAETNVFRLLAPTEDLSAHVVLLPHHGSRVEPPMDAILPEWKNVIISARESFVPAERLETLEDADCAVFPTWRCGAVTVVLDGERPVIRTQKKADTSCERADRRSSRQAVSEPVAGENPRSRAAPAPAIRETPAR